MCLISCGILFTPESTHLCKTSKHRIINGTVVPPLIIHSPLVLADQVDPTGETERAEEENVKGEH